MEQVIYGREMKGGDQGADEAKAQRSTLGREDVGKASVVPSAVTRSVCA